MDVTRTRAARRRAGKHGFTVIEMTIAAALLSLLAVSGISALTVGTNACQQVLAEQEAVRQAGRLVEAIAFELKDASAASVVYSTAQPDRLTFQRVLAYDPDSFQPILSTPITIRRVAMTVPGTSGLSIVERAQTGARTSRLAGYVAELDGQDASLPGLQFDVLSAAGIVRIDVAVTLSVPSGPRGPQVLRLATTVKLDAP